MKTLSYLLVAALLGLASYSHATSVVDTVIDRGPYTAVYIEFDTLPNDVTDLQFVIDSTPWPSNLYARRQGAPHVVNGLLIGYKDTGGLLPATLADWDDGYLVQVFYSHAGQFHPWAVTGGHLLEVTVLAPSLPGGSELINVPYTLGVLAPDGGASAGLLALATGGLILMRRRH